MSKLILKVKNLNVELEGEKIIENLAFEVKKGDVLTILGPNGAGKTILLKTLLGLLPYRGEIHWMPGIKIGYVPQRLPFIKETPMSVGEFFELKGASKKEIRTRPGLVGQNPVSSLRSEIEETLNSVGFEENFLNKNIGELSSGQFQRILIAWALIGSPDVLLFDEPTTGVDIGGEETIYGLLAKLNKERNLTILLVTHDLSVVYKFSDYVICLNKCPICQGSPKEVLIPGTLRKLYGEEVKFYEHHKH
jgi:zinc transport system ATP-binding protein